MRRLPFLLAALAACQAHDTPSKPVDGTDDPPLIDSEPVDTLPTDTDAAPPADSAAVTGDTASVCVVPLDRPRFPLTWDADGTTYDNRCVWSWRCEGPDEAVVVWESQCFGYRAGYYDPAGQLVAEAYGSDTSGCPRYDFATWAGYYVASCPFDPATARASAHCATPNAPPPEVTNDPSAITFPVTSPPPLPAESWAQAEERLADVCHGRVMCSLSSGHTVAVVATPRGACAGHSFAAFDMAGSQVGVHVNTFFGSMLWVPGATSEQLIELEACLGQVFLPSAACGFVEL